MSILLLIVGLLLGAACAVAFGRRGARTRDEHERARSASACATS